MATFDINVSVGTYNGGTGNDVFNFYTRGVYLHIYGNAGDDRFNFFADMPWYFELLGGRRNTISSGSPPREFRRLARSDASPRAASAAVASSVQSPTARQSGSSAVAAPAATSSVPSSSSPFASLAVQNTGPFSVRSHAARRFRL